MSTLNVAKPEAKIFDRIDRFPPGSAGRANARLNPTAINARAIAKSNKLTHGKSRVIGKLIKKNRKLKPLISVSKKPAHICQLNRLMFTY